MKEEWSKRMLARARGMSKRKEGMGTQTQTPIFETMRFLKQAYPRPLNSWKLIVVISSFIAFFLMVFQPFGLSELPGVWKWGVIIGYGAVTAAMLVLNLVVLPYLLPRWFGEKHWTVGKEILSLLWILFCIGAGNFFYTQLFFDLAGSFLAFQLYTLSVGLMPIVGVTLVSQNIRWKQNFKKAQELNALIPDLQKQDESPVVELVSERNKIELTVSLDQLLYLESQGNYISIFYLNEGEAASCLIRNTLKQMEEQFQPFNHVVRCHRAFLVNIDRVTKVSGNAQGLTLYLSGNVTPVPVARSYVPVIKSLLK